MQKLLLLLMALVVSHGALAQAGEGSGAQVGSQPPGYLTRTDAFIELTGYRGVRQLAPSSRSRATTRTGTTALYNGIIAVAWAPELVYAPWIWYYLLTP